MPCKVWITHDEFVYVLREYDEMKEAIKNLKTSEVYQKFWTKCRTILSYCLKCWKNTENKNPRVARKLKPWSKCAMCDSKKSGFMKKQEESRLLSNVGIITSLNEIPLLGDILFWRYKMNEIVNKFLLAGDKFMPEMHLRQLGFTYRACGPFIKNKERTQKFKETKDSRSIY